MMEQNDGEDITIKAKDNTKTFLRNWLLASSRPDQNG